MPFLGVREVERQRRAARPELEEVSHLPGRSYVVGVVPSVRLRLVSSVGKAGCALAISPGVP